MQRVKFGLIKYINKITFPFTMGWGSKLSKLDWAKYNFFIYFLNETGLPSQTENPEQSALLEVTVAKSTTNPDFAAERKVRLFADTPYVQFSISDKKTTFTDRHYQNYVFGQFDIRKVPDHLLKEEYKNYLNQDPNQKKEKKFLEQILSKISI